MENVPRPLLFETLAFSPICFFTVICTSTSVRSKLVSSLDYVQTFVEEISTVDARHEDTDGCLQLLRSFVQNQWHLYWFTSSLKKNVTNFTIINVDVRGLTFTEHDIVRPEGMEMCGTWTRYKSGILYSGGMKMGAGRGCATGSAFYINSLPWEVIRLPDLQICRYSHAMVTIKGVVYAISGPLDYTWTSDSCEKFDGKDWYLLANMPCGMSAPIACGMKNNIYVTETFGEGIQVYNTEINSWKQIEFMPEDGFWQLIPDPKQDKIFIVQYGQKVLKLHELGANDEAATFCHDIQLKTDLNPTGMTPITGGTVQFQDYVYYLSEYKNRSSKELYSARLTLSSQELQHGFVTDFVGFNV